MQKCKLAPFDLAHPVYFTIFPDIHLISTSDNSVIEVGQYIENIVDISPISVSYRHFRYRFFRYIDIVSVTNEMSV